MKRGEVIHRRYLVSEALPPGGKSENARVLCEGSVYFLKRFAQPKYPFDPAKFDASKIDKLKELCGEFERRHVEILKLLDRPMLGGGNLVKPTDFFREKGTYYKVYPFVQSESSLKIAKAELADQVLFAKTLLLSIRELHARDIVHSDLKPDNVLVERRPVGPVAKLIDFDEAFISEKPPRRVSGDITYASPELGKRLDGAPGDPGDLTTKSDIFSVGLVVHQIVTGALPSLSGATGESLGDGVLNGGSLEFLPLNGFPTEFADALQHTGEREPQNRPSIDDLLAGLGVNQPIRRPPTTGERAGKPPPQIQINMGRRTRDATS